MCVIHPQLWIGSVDNFGITMSDLQVQSWSSPKPFAFGLVIASVALLIGAVISRGDPAGAVLIVIAALLTFSFGAVAAFVRPRLRLVSTPAGSPTLTVRTIFGAQTYASADVQRIRILDFRRMGRRIGHLEFEFYPQEPAVAVSDAEAAASDIDDSRIVVMGRWELGVDIHEVADALDAAGFHVER